MKNLKMSIAAMLLLAVSFTNAQEKENEYGQNARCKG